MPPRADNRFASPLSRRKPSRRLGFTLVELLVVMLIITVLVSSVLVAGSALITSSKASNTRAVLSIVDQSVQAFRREQRSRPTLTRLRQGPVSYVDRYGMYPPDELEVFTRSGLPGSGSKGFSAAPGQTDVYPGPPYPKMEYNGQAPPTGQEANEHRDIAALYLAIQLFGTDSKVILDRVQDRYWQDASVDSTSGDPLAFLDRNGNNSWDAADMPIRYLLDDWGVPLNYMSQRDFEDNPPPQVTPAAPSSNDPEWGEASTEMIHLNRGRPIIFSWGPNGPDQLTPDAMSDDTASLVGDFMDGALHRIDNVLNDDNIYASKDLKSKLEKGAP